METMELSLNDRALLESLIACPQCGGKLDWVEDALACTACDLRRPQPAEGWLDLLPDHLLSKDETRWEGRQEEMEAWYTDLATNPQWATWCFEADYGPFAGRLATCSGTVLDLGGGNGVARHYLPPDVRYVVLDPSLDWLRPMWTAIAPSFPCLATPPPFVRGVGEHLPFRDEAFDAVLAFYSLNHVSQPERVLAEVGRVLRPGGRFFAVLEDMEPRWGDLLRPPFRSRPPRQLAAAWIAKARAQLPGQAWPLQEDHLRIRERDLLAQSAPWFDVARRAWVGKYLTYEFQKHPALRP